MARANRTGARSALEIADRELSRIETLRKRGVSTESQLDADRARQLSAKAELEIADAQVTRAESSLETARIKLGYTNVSADWTGGKDQLLVAETFVSEGDTVSANTPLVSILELDPITGVIFVTEKDYAHLTPGQPAALSTDAFADRSFSGKISRIAPVFKETTRQARVEFTVDNPGHLLKPGMFIRVRVELDRATDAVIIPETALTVRNDRTGVFIIHKSGETVSWREVTTGIRDGNLVQLHGKDLEGKVVILGQQLLKDGSRIRLSREPVDNRSSL